MANITKIKLLNKHRDDIPADAVYIGRGSIYGNPYSRHIKDKSHHYYVATKEEAIFKYEEYIRSKPRLMKRLLGLKDKIIYCHCAPAACHGDIIIKIVSELLLQEEE